MSWVSQLHKFGGEADFKHQKSLLTLSSCEYRQDHNLIFLHDAFISKNVSQNSKSFKFFVGSNFNEFGEKNTEFQKIHFFQVRIHNLRRRKFYFQEKARYHRCCNLYLQKSIIWDIIIVKLKKLPYVLYIFSYS